MSRPEIVLSGWLGLGPRWLAVRPLGLRRAPGFTAGSRDAATESDPDRYRVIGGTGVLAISDRRQLVDWACAKSVCDA